MGINIPARGDGRPYACPPCLAGVAGVLLAPLSTCRPQMGTIIGLKAFAVAIIGGLQLGPRHRGGRARLRAGGVLHRRLRLDARAREIVGFGLVILVLVVRPWGLLGEKPSRRV